MTTSHSNPNKQKSLGLFFAIAAILVVIGYLLLASTDEVKSVRSHDLFQAFGVTWELQDIEWREAEGLYALAADAVPVRGTGQLPSNLSDATTGLCGAILSGLPRNAPVDHRRGIFRVRVTLPTVGPDGNNAEFVSGVQNGACIPKIRGNKSFLTYPGLASNWYLSEWMADNADLEGFTVVFRKTGDVALSSLDFELACRAALFDLPDLLPEHLKAFNQLRSIEIVAETGIDAGLLNLSRSFGKEIDIGPGGCGKVRDA